MAKVSVFERTGVGGAGRPPLRLLGGAGGKYIPVANLDQEQLRERRAYELAKKQAQRARKRGVEPEEYRENVARNVTRVRQNKELRVRERETRADERRILREELVRGRVADKRNWNRSMWNRKGSDRDLMVPGVGQSIRKNRAKARTHLRKNLRKLAEVAKADDWEWVMDEMRRARMGTQPLEIRKTYTYHDGVLNKWTIDGGKNRDPAVFLDLCRPLVRRVVVETKGPILRVEAVLDVKLRRLGMNPEVDEDKTDDHGFRSGVHDVMLDSDFDDQWGAMVSTLLIDISKHQSRGSGWVLDGIDGLSVYVSVSSPLSGRSHIPLPEWIGKKSGVVNLKNKGDDCFPLAVAAADILRKCPSMRNLERVPEILKRRAAELKMGDLKLPMRICDIPKFDELNPCLNVAVYGSTRRSGR